MDGLIIIDKGPGISSQSAVSAVKRLLHEKAGHCGTLDPMATGVLPVCLGRATRLSEYIMGQHKVYQARLLLGRETDSYDITGVTLAAAGAPALTQDQLAAVLPQFRGEIQQRPPLISALKQGGETLYRKARRGETPDIPSRPVQIYRLELTDFQPGPFPEAQLTVECGQGAYIRSLAHDIGAVLGCGGCLAALRRTRVGELEVSRGLTIEELAAQVASGQQSFLISMEDAVRRLPACSPAVSQLPALAHGNAVAVAQPLPPGPLRILDGQEQLLAIGHQGEDGQLIPDKVLAEAEAYDDSLRWPVVALGTFDGLHLGHQALFRAAAAVGGPRAAVTFDVHPLSLVKGCGPRLLTDSRLKKALLRQYMGMDGVIVLTFDQELMNSSPRDFVERILIQRLGAQQVVVGYNYTFAQGGAGNTDVLRQLCAERGVGVTVVDEVDGPWGPISASNIRSRLAEGDMEAVNSMLGYWLTAELRQQADGSWLALAEQALPPAGAYAARLEDVGDAWLRVGEGTRPPLALTPLLASPLPKRLRLSIGPACADEAAARAYFADCPVKKHLPNRIK